MYSQSLQVKCYRSKIARMSRVYYIFITDGARNENRGCTGVMLERWNRFLNIDCSIGLRGVYGELLFMPLQATGIGCGNGIPSGNC